jgi:hypothetical protein
VYTIVLETPKDLTRKQVQLWRSLCNLFTRKGGEKRRNVKKKREKEKKIT